MRRNRDQPRQSEPNSTGATVDRLAASPPPTLMTHAAEYDGKTFVTQIEETGEHFSRDIYTLRRQRLRVTALILIVMMSVFLAWRLVFGGGELWHVNVVIICGIGAALAYLSQPHPITTRRFKAIELAIFGLMIVYLAIRQYHGIAGGRDDGTELLATSRGTMIGSILLMFIYAMLVPNTWHAATPVILTISLAPTVTKLLFFAIHPTLYKPIRDAMTPAMMSENVVFMAVASGLAIYGVHVLNSLRFEAFEAKQLNQYKLIRLLGSGGMGVVYLAEHRMMKRPCALKQIRPDFDANPVSLERFEREVRATAQLSHPNTVEIYDYGRAEDGTFYYVMEYLYGLTLEELVERHGAIPPGRAIYLLRQACAALAEAHGSGLIHRDLKPANIFAARRGGEYDFTKLLDFGLVKDLHNEGEHASIRGNAGQGTPHYMAPEQVAGLADLDHRVDLYALGCVAYTLVTGRPPFKRPSVSRVMAAHAHEPVEPPSKFRPDLPADLERVILRCLEKSPDARHPDAKSLARDLDSCTSAADWDAQAAERWWHDHVPDAEHRCEPISAGVS
jgi:tRNA A-37 threonylcarbamoyl transferase component Bud32